MSNYYKLITEKNKLSLNKPQDCDMVYYSELNEWYTANAFRTFSVKCVLENTIYYKAGSVEYPVMANNFLLAMKQSNAKAYFNSKKEVKSICIDICPATAGEVFSLLTGKKDPDFDNYLSGYFKYPSFMDNIYSLENSLTGEKLKDIIRCIKYDKYNVPVTKDWIYGLTEQIIYQEYNSYISLNNIKSLKPSTKKEIYRRVNIGKDYMDVEFLKTDCIKQIADVSFMSQYYFFRSFKQVFGITPYQYLLTKRLAYAGELLKSRTLSVTEIAALCGFTDIFTFSKAFKKVYHVSPSLYTGVDCN